MASSIVTIAVIKAVAVTDCQRAVEANKSGQTLALLLGIASSMARAIIGAGESVASDARIASLAEANTVFAGTVVVAVVRAGKLVAVDTRPFSRAFTSTINTDAVPRAI